MPGETHVRCGGAEREDQGEECGRTRAVSRRRKRPTGHSEEFQEQLESIGALRRARRRRTPTTTSRSHQEHKKGRQCAGGACGVSAC
mmetsp:Transcript_35905/g.116270  ORF Transcript_35905/g.116270 Transcript_35905/m.116270 type:complete len:87 (-) Transcript_35905:159-419(-)